MFLNLYRNTGRKGFMRLNELLHHLIGYRFNHHNNPRITSIEVDSREIQAGSLFVCINGYTMDGHDFVGEAVKRGAAAIVANHPVAASVPVAVVKDTSRAASVLADVFYKHPTRDLHLIGVTGTNGKTTTTNIIEKILSDHGQSTGLIGTIGMKIGDETFNVKNTTPETVTLQKGFSEMAGKGVHSAVMEVSSHALDMGRVRGCDFNIAVFTNLSQDHLDYHPTMENYLRAKGLLFSQLGNTYGNDALKAAVLNGDDEASKTLEKMTSAQIVTYGIKTDCDITAKNIKLSEKGTTFRLDTPLGCVDVQLKLIGMFSVYNALAAASACLLSGISVTEIKKSLEEVEGVPGRFEAVDEGQPYTVIVDYAHTPDSLENILTTVKEFAERKIYIVVGCGGDRDRSKRALMAQVAAKYSDHAVFTSDNPRSEDPRAIIKDMEAGIDNKNYVVITDRREAIRYAVKNAKEKDIIVIAGKGHETYQVIGSQVIDFDDRIVAREAIKEKA
jgi:UDP-N-acetylmuramoyl-L-alanyl-D-glutamate--2,6-diaminopimelate ligase